MRRIVRIGSVIVAACLSSSAPLAAQPVTAPLPVGARLRVTAPCEARPSTSCVFAGDLLALRGDTARIDVGGVATDLALSLATRVERSDGRRTHRLAGAALGFSLIGGGLYLWMDSNEFCDPSDNQDAIGVRECLALAGLAGVGGAGLGALIGHFVRTERWREVPAERVRISVAPDARGGVALTHLVSR